ncbi:peptide chain release factor 3 [Quadrisphaera sp. GCM10027208]|uniref:peptide chain release factor 3 n=1 Tax=Quadrisphaera sp. GCM10027208 TaxID=3273423 RepID=UPI003608C6AE
MTAQVPDPEPAADPVTAQAARRRTFAVISHPDAGKSTLTEALALHGGAIAEAGHVKAKSGRRGVVSDWQEMERARGISISSAALQFEYRDHVVNLLDTPGHADFSEDTYRVLAAVDCAVMLVDAAKGMERQTMKLFDVCAYRGLPVITVINKWDRPGQEALALMDEIESRTGMVPTPLTWPVGIAGDFRGVLDRRTGDYVRFSRTAGGATRAPQDRLDAGTAAEREGDVWHTAVEEVALLEASGAVHDPETFAAGASTPVLFASAVLNFGVDQLLDVLLASAPAPSARRAADGHARPVGAPFSGQVFKVQAGMDRAHRDRMAFVRVCSGHFERGMAVVNSRTGRSFSTKYAQQVFGSDRSGAEEAWPGDVVGLVNASSLHVGDTLYADEPVTFPPIPAFAPEHFVVARARDVSRYKQFQRGMAELDSEGVVQVLRSDRRGDQSPVLAAVGPMQFDVVTHRMEHEFHAPVILEPLGYSVARRTIPTDVEVLDAQRNVEVLWRIDGTPLAVFSDAWRLSAVQRDHPRLVLEPLAADRSA